MAAQPFDVVMTDYLMPGMNGAEFVGAARGVQPVAMVMITGYIDTPEVRRLEDAGHLFCVVGKPWERRTIIDVVARAQEHTRALRARALQR